MSYYYEVKVTYERQTGETGLRKVCETYLVGALSFTEAEERIVKEVQPQVFSDTLEVVGVKRVKLAELHLSDDEPDDRYYRARVGILTLDERTNTEREQVVSVLVQAESLQLALDKLLQEWERMLCHYRVNSIAETQIMDVYLYNAPEEQ